MEPSYNRATLTSSFETLIKQINESDLNGCFFIKNREGKIRLVSTRISEKKIFREIKWNEAIQIIIKEVHESKHLNKEAIDSALEKLVKHTRTLNQKGREYFPALFALSQEIVYRHLNPSNKPMEEIIPTLPILDTKIFIGKDFLERHEDAEIKQMLLEVLSGKSGVIEIQVGNEVHSLESKDLSIRMDAKALKEILEQDHVSLKTILMKPFKLKAHYLSSEYPQEIILHPSLVLKSAPLRTISNLEEDEAALEFPISFEAMLSVNMNIDSIIITEGNIDALLEASGFLGLSDLYDKCEEIKCNEFKETIKSLKDKEEILDYAVKMYKYALNKKSKKLEELAKEQLPIPQGDFNLFLQYLQKLAENEVSLIELDLSLTRGINKESLRKINKMHPNIAILSLNVHQSTDIGVTDLLQFKELESLVISDWRHPALEEFSFQEGFEHLKYLYLGEINKMTGLLLEKCPNLESLHIDTRYTQATNDIVKFLIKLPKLKDLTLTRTKVIRSEEIHDLALNLIQLERLTLLMGRWVDVNDVVKNSIHFKNLKSLYISHFHSLELSDEFFNDLLNFPSLEELHIRDAWVFSDSDLQKLKEECKKRHLPLKKIVFRNLTYDLSS